MKESKTVHEHSITATSQHFKQYKRFRSLKDQERPHLSVIGRTADFRVHYTAHGAEPGGRLIPQLGNCVILHTIKAP